MGKAVDGVSFSIRRERPLVWLARGCGKTTTGRMLLRIIEPTAGSIIYHDSSGPVDIAELDLQELWNLRRRMQMIFQDPIRLESQDDCTGDRAGAIIAMGSALH